MSLQSKPNKNMRAKPNVILKCNTFNHMLTVVYNKTSVGSLVQCYSRCDVELALLCFSPFHVLSKYTHFPWTLWASEWRQREGRRWGGMWIKLPSSVTRKILPPLAVTRMMLFAITTFLGPSMIHTVDTSPTSKISKDEQNRSEGI